MNGGQGRASVSKRNRSTGPGRRRGPGAPTVRRARAGGRHEGAARLRSDWLRPEMRSLVLEGTRRLAWQEVPEPQRQHYREAIVRPLAVATCDLDQPMIFGMT